jgi:A/G-specific adenine glycosylase
MVKLSESPLLKWYAEHRRDLPWRKTQNPYEIWISEMMLQQTRVDTVIPYYLLWMEKYPDINLLAAASRDEVLKSWEGLGYYRRAHAIHETAAIILFKYEGKFPSEISELRQLPGIGPYTSSAIAAFAFEQDILTIDGNVRRVLSRWMDLEIDPRTRQGETRLLDWASATMPSGMAAEYNQAVMDLGALLCTAKNPSCNSCPLASTCLAHQRGTQSHRPVRSPRKKSPSHTAAAAVLLQEERVLIGRRPEGKLLGGLWEFPGGKQEDGESIEACLRREIKEELDVEIKVGASLGAFKHAYTHFKITVVAFFAEIAAGEPKPLDHTRLAWVHPSELDEYPMGKIDRAIANELRLQNEMDS